MARPTSAVRPDARPDLYTRVTNAIVADLDRGVRPWTQPWSNKTATSSVSRPLRHNGQPYNGINVVLLWSEAAARGFIEPTWMMGWTAPATADVNSEGASHRAGGPTMQLTTIGFDLGKNVFQVHGVTADGQVIVRKKLGRAEVLPFFRSLDPCLVGMEACFSAHHWGRELAALGHQVKLMPPSYVKPYVKRGKNDAVDAEAICEAVSRPTMRYVPLKSAEQQSVLMLHRIRDQLVRQRTSLYNALRAHLSEVGIIAPPGVKRVPELLQVVEAERDRLPALMLCALEVLLRQLQEVKDRIREVEQHIFGWAKTNDAARRLATIPGVGPVTAAAIAATVTDPSHFKSGRQFAAWIGLVPRQNSSGGKDRLGSISKMGDRYLRRLLVVGATSIIRYARTRGGPRQAWAMALLERRPARLVSVALANKAARIAWAILTRGEVYRPGVAGAL